MTNTSRRSVFSLLLLSSGVFLIERECKAEGVWLRALRVSGPSSCEAVGRGRESMVRDRYRQVQAEVVWEGRSQKPWERDAGSQNAPFIPGLCCFPAVFHLARGESWAFSAAVGEGWSGVADTPCLRALRRPSVWA